MSKIIQPANDPAWRETLLQTLETRFKQHSYRHKEIKWAAVLERLDGAEKWRSLYEMERTGGEPDVIGQDPTTGEWVFCDCSAESPAGRRSVCYDRQGLEARKEHRPLNTAVDMATGMGITLLSEAEYRSLQQFTPVDTKTSSWLQTPDEMRQLGGALFGDYRFGRVFIYHNGAQSYYGARGFRGKLLV